VGLGIGNRPGSVDPPAIAGGKKRHFIAVHEPSKGGDFVSVTAVVLGGNLALTSFLRLGVEIKQYSPPGQPPGLAVTSPKACLTSCAASR